MVQKQAEMFDLGAAAAALRLAGAAIYEWRPDSAQLAWTDAAAAQDLLGQEDPASITSPDGFHSLLPEDAQARRERFVAARGGDGRSLRHDYAVRTSAGGVVWVEERAEWRGEGASACVIGVLRSINDQKRRERFLTSAAAQDELTGLLPRDRMREAVETALARAARHLKPTAYVTLAVHDLAMLNTRFGFDAADQVIAAVGERIGRSARPQDLVGRTAGNKFGVLLANCSTDMVAGAAQRLVRAACETVVETAAGPVQPTLSVGVAVADAGGETGGDLMARSEAALDLAKRGGPGQIEVAEKGSAFRSQRAANAETGARVLDALVEDRVVIVFQPIVDARTRTPVRFECLARLQDETGALGDKADFIAAAEASGLVRRLDQRVLSLAQDVLRKNADVRLSVNVSGATVRDDYTAKAYLLELERLSAEAAARLTVELTETYVVEAPEQVVDFAQRVRAAGARFAVDDFGAGYTSFRQLKALRPDEVKIDGIYACGASEQGGDISFVQALVHLARALSMEVVAEWVDAEADAAALQAVGVDRLQGHLFGKAAPTLIGEPAPPRKTARAV